MSEPTLASEPTVALYTYYHGATIPVGGTPLTSDWLAPGFCEMRGHYKIWRAGPRTDFVGFQQYRRRLDVRGRAKPPAENNPELFVQCEQEVPSSLFLMATSDDKAPDWIVATAWPLGKSVADQYREAHDPRDWKSFARLAPELADLGEELDFYNVCNIFLTSWAEFDRYMTFWWNLICRIKFTVNEGQQARAPAFLSERIFSLWLHRERERRALRIREISLLMDLSRAP